MFNSLRSRLWLTYALVVGVIIVILGAGLVVYLIRNPVEMRQEYGRLRTSLLIVVPVIQQNPALQTGLVPGRVQLAAEQLDKWLNVRVALFDPQWHLLVDSRLNSAPGLPAQLRPVQKSVDKALQLRDRNGRIWLYVLHQLSGGDTLMLAVPYPRLRVVAVLQDDFIGPFTFSAGVALLLALLLAAGIARWVAAPLQRMANAARAVSASNPGTNIQPIPLEGPSEVHDLAQAFNEMAARVRTSQQSQRDFVANVSHELKTPLTSIQGFSQAILDGTVETPEAQRQAAQVIFNEAGRMHRLVLDLLDLARMDAGTVSFTYAPLDLAGLLAAVAEKFAPSALQTQVTLQVEIGDLPEILGDGDRLTQVFTNLMDNALKFTPAGGRILVKANPLGNAVEISVADSGPGIPSEDLPRIFERFYQSDKSRRGGSGRGVGLGLAIAREIVQAHGGSLTAYNQAGNGANSENPSGQGSVFVVKIPFARADDFNSAKRGTNLAAQPPVRSA